MDVTMKNRVAVVTGGSKGIGLAVVRRFAESGAKVAMLARGAEDLKAAREHLARDGIEVRDYVCDVSKAADILKTHDRGSCRSGPDRCPRQQCRNLARDGVRDRDRRDLAGRSRSKTVRRNSLQPTGLAGHEGAQMGPHHQRAEHRRQGACGCVNADLGIAGGRHGADQGHGERRRPAQHPGQCDAGGADRQRSMGQAACCKSAGDRLRRLHARTRQGRAARPHGDGGGIRQPRLLPRLRARLVHHRHRHQCRWRAKAASTTSWSMPCWSA